MRHFARVLASPVNTKIEKIIVWGSFSAGIALLIGRIIINGGA